jgi:hypothetical protein
MTDFLSAYKRMVEEPLRLYAPAGGGAIGKKVRAARGIP